MTRRTKKGVKFSRENVYTRDHGMCQYCSRKIPRTEATYDHVTPRRLGGLTRWENIVIACIECNRDKGGRTPEQAGMKLRQKPVKPKSNWAQTGIYFYDTTVVTEAKALTPDERRELIERLAQEEKNSRERNVRRPGTLKGTVKYMAPDFKKTIWSAPRSITRARRKPKCST